MFNRFFNTLIFILLFTFSIGAQAVVIYVTDGDADNLFIVDTDTQSFQTIDTSGVPFSRASGLAVRDTIWITDMDDEGSAEFDLLGNLTGATRVSDEEFSQMLDGTSDDAGNNYASVWSSTGVVIADHDWQNSSVLFDPGFEIIGITYDPVDDTLWVINDESNTVHKFTLGGSELDSFVADLGDRNCCLAFDRADNTLWLATNGGDTFYQYDRDGNQLDSVQITDWVSGNIWGADIASGVALRVTPVPTLNPLGITFMLLALFGLGAIFLRRQKAI